jgi:hypothetical protein
MRILSLIVILMLFITFNLMPFESVLLDFSNLDGTLIDFSTYANQDIWTKDQIEAMKLDLNPANWVIKVCNSSWTTMSREYTKILPVKNSLNFPNEVVLGIKIYFPDRGANSYAEIKPPFVIPSYYDNPNEPDGMGGMFLNKGIVRNVGLLRKLSVRVLGNNFKYVLYVRIEDRKGEQRDIYVGYLDYVGWKTKSWVNPNIDGELKMREIYKNSKPYYPDEMPYVKLVEFIIHRAEPQVTGNFATMIKDVFIEYDEAFLEVGKAEYLQESIFGIYKQQLMDRARHEMKNVDQRIYLEWEEQQKMDKTWNYRNNSSSSSSASTKK